MTLKLLGKGSISGRMFADTNGDNTELNATGGFEPGLAGQTVTLLVKPGKVVATTVTDEFGNYTFTNLPAAEYRVLFPKDVNGAPLVVKDVGNEGIDSDAFQDTGKTPSIFLKTGQIKTEVDAGYAFDNADPEANNDSFTTLPGESVSGNVLTNDTDPDGDPLTVEGITQNPANGTVSIAPNGQFTYTPNAAFSGPDQFTYRISDGNGGFDTAQVFINVRPSVVDGEACQKGAFNEELFTGIELKVANAVAGSVPVSNTNAQAGDSVTFKNAGTTADGTVIEARLVLETKSSANLQVDLAAQGRFDDVYGILLNGNNDASMQGQTATFRLEFFDQATGQPVSIHPAIGFGDLDNARGAEVISINDPNLANVAVTADSRVAINYDGNTSLSASGTVPDNNPLAPQDQFAALFDSTNSLTFTVTSRGFNSGIVFAKPDAENLIALKNTAPDAEDDAFVGTEADVITGRVLENDSDADKDKICVIDNSNPANGTLVINRDGSFVYTPNQGFVGEDSFTYTISDGKGGTDTATATLRVTSSNTAPEANDDTGLSTTLGTPLTIDVLANDSDPDGDPLTITDVRLNDPAQGTVEIVGNKVVFTPADPSVNTTAEIIYTVSDGRGGEDTASAFVAVRPLVAPNSAPVAGDDSILGQAGGAITGSVLDNDSDPDDDPLTVVGNTTPANGRLFIGPDGTFAYLPNPGFTGEDSFTYTVSDGKGGTDTATVTLKVNAAPEANDDPVLVQEGAPITGNVLDNDSDPEGNPLTIVGNTTPQNGTLVLNPDGSFTYTPDADFTGEDSFTYEVSDGDGGRSSATVTFTVNAAPEANDDPLVVQTGAPLSGNVLDNDSDPEGNPLTIVGNTTPQNGTLAS
jgi:large repetitive protein